MPKEKRLLVDVGLNDFPYPMKVVSKVDPDGQSTVASISINARIIHEYEAQWIDRFITILHRHQDKIGTATLRANIRDYMNELSATMVRINFDYPFFVLKRTLVSGAEFLVRYHCTYSAKMSASDDNPRIIFRMEVPTITTDPASAPDAAGGLYGQLSTVNIEVQSQKDLFPEDLVDIVDRHALSPVYSFLTVDDQRQIIQKVHSEKKSSVVMTDEIKEELARTEGVDWYAVRCANHSMLHSHSTVVATEKSMLIPSVCYEFDEL